MFFVPLTAWAVSLITAGIPWLKEKTEKSIPAENWANKDLVWKDRRSGMSEKEILKNVQRGKYYLKNDYQEPHRDPKTGRVIVENCLLYNEDLKKYGYSQVLEWVQRGKYNLTPEELKKEKERINKELKELYNLPYDLK